MVSLTQEGIVICRVLPLIVVAYNNALHLLHIRNLMHLDGAFVNGVLKTWFVGASVEFVIWKEKVLPYLVSKFVTLFKSVGGVIGVHQNDAQVCIREAGVHM